MGKTYRRDSDRSFKKGFKNKNKINKLKDFGKKKNPKHTDQITDSNEKWTEYFETSSAQEL